MVQRSGGTAAINTFSFEYVYLYTEYVEAALEVVMGGCWKSFGVHARNIDIKSDEDMMEQCSSVFWKAELVNNNIGYLAEEIPKQSVLKEQL